MADTIPELRTQHAKLLEQYRQWLATGDLETANQFLREAIQVNKRGQSLDCWAWHYWNPSWPANWDEH